MGFEASDGRCKSNCLGVVARAVRNHSLNTQIELANRVESTSKLESAHPLEEFTLEEKLSTTATLPSTRKN